MPAYNFQKQFVPMILDRSKVHTIRKRRKRPTKAGDMLMLYTGMRTKQCELIAISDCIKVSPISIIRGVGVRLEGNLLSDEEVHALARADGFSDGWQFFDFFDRYPFEVISSELELIYWDVGDVFLPKMGQKHGEVRLQLGGSK